MPGCTLGYVAHCDPQGTLPPWLVNKVTHTLGPRMVKDLKKAAVGYTNWKIQQKHLRKPWRFPEEITCPRIAIADVIYEMNFLLKTKSNEFPFSLHSVSAMKQVINPWMIYPQPPTFFHQKHLHYQPFLASPSTIHQL